MAAFNFKPGAAKQGGPPPGTPTAAAPAPTPGVTDEMRAQILM